MNFDVQHYLPALIFIGIALLFYIQGHRHGAALENAVHEATSGAQAVVDQHASEVHDAINEVHQTIATLRDELHAHVEATGTQVAELTDHVELHTTAIAEATDGVASAHERLDEHGIAQSASDPEHAEVVPALDHVYRAESHADALAKVAPLTQHADPQVAEAARLAVGVLKDGLQRAAEDGKRAQDEKDGGDAH